jgi:glutamate racemase
MTKKLKILTTDSGLGGLSITAELVEKIKKEGQFEEAEITFFNCRPSDKSAYAHLDSNESRAKVFSEALYAMHKKFQPDVIMIACNTLSAIYGMCEFSKNPPVPVVGIIEDGVEEIYNLLITNPEMDMIMFGTAATVNSGAHRDILTGKGIDPSRLYYQNCMNLPSIITHDAESDEVKELVGEFMKSAVAKTNGKAFGISLLCTHFEYSLQVFSKAAKNFDNFSGDIINPNSAMVDSFLKKYKSGKNIKTTVKCFSHTKISPQIHQTLFPLLNKISPDTAEAFSNIFHTPYMFPYEIDPDPQGATKLTPEFRKRN